MQTTVPQGSPLTLSDVSVSAVSMDLPGVEGAGGASGTFTCSCLFTDLPPPARTAVFRAVYPGDRVWQGMREGPRTVKALQALQSGDIATGRTGATETTMSEEESCAPSLIGLPKNPFERTLSLAMHAQGRLQAHDRSPPACALDQCSMLQGRTNPSTLMRFPPNIAPASAPCSSPETDSRTGITQTFQHYLPARVIEPTQNYTGAQFTGRGTSHGLQGALAVTLPLLRWIRW